MFNNELIVDGNDIRLNIPFVKVNKERRTVSGFATLDNVDTHGDVVEADASEKAFSNFRGNLREMHQPIAVGKVVSFAPQNFEDPETGDAYKGIFVTAYVSTGAQDTWEKVLDGTLSGFSIGGVIKKKDVNKGGGRGSIIKEYELMELSLVDNPANQLANVLSFQKVGDTTVASGLAVETKVMNVHYNHEDDVVILSDQEQRDGFENIGWVEDCTNPAQEISKVVEEYKQKYLEGSLDQAVSNVREAWYKQHRNRSNPGQDDYSYEYVMSVFDSFVVTSDEEGNYYRYNYSEGEDGFEFGQAIPVEITMEISEKSADSNEQDSETSSLNKSEGGANVATEEKKDETVEEVEKSAEVEETKDDDQKVTEKAAEVSEVPAGDTVDADAIIKAVSESVTAAVTEVAEKSANSVKEVNDSLTEALDALKKEVSGLNEKFEGLDERVSGVETGTAVKKSVDVVEDDVEEDEEEGFWRGGFLGSKGLV